MKEEKNLNKIQTAKQNLTKEEKDLIKELYTVCPNCSSDIAILSIDENKVDEEISVIMKYKCLNENIVNNISIKEYIKLIKENKEKKIEKLKDQCEKHLSKKYISYCFDCKCHLCEDCLKTGVHLEHVKNNIIEVKPFEEELNIIREVINDYELRIRKIKKEKENKKSEYDKLINKNKKILEEKLHNISEKNKIKKNIELENNKNKYILDIDNIKREYENKIRKRKSEYLEENNKIYNKYKLITEKYIINYNNKIKELINYYEKEMDKYKFEKKVENYDNKMKINIMIYDIYNNYNNNYYNSININSLLLYYINNDYINNKIMKIKLKEKYNDIVDTIYNRKGNEQANIEKLKNDYKEKIQKLENQYKNEISKLKNEVS